jgi:anthranilate synthase component 2
MPILGVCLGHQSLGQAFGGKITHARQVMHGKTSLIHHNKEDLFENLPSPYTATRYHSLIIDQKSLPECFKITAWTKLPNGEMDEIMGIRHLDLPLFGIQFHPESILTEHGHLLLENFLKR